MEKPQTKINWPKSRLLLVGVAVVLIALIASASAAYLLRNPEAEDAQDTPLNPTATPTITPSPTPVIAELHMASNLTVGSFYKGDTLRITASYTPATAGVTITLRNIGINGDVIVTTALTNAEGKVVFDRNPVNPFHYYVTVES